MRSDLHSRRRVFPRFSRCHQAAVTPELDAAWWIPPYKDEARTMLQLVKSGEGPDAVRSLIDVPAELQQRWMQAPDWLRQRLQEMRNFRLQVRTEFERLLKLEAA